MKKRMSIPNMGEGAMVTKAHCMIDQKKQKMTCAGKVLVRGKERDFSFVFDSGEE